MQFKALSFIANTQRLDAAYSYSCRGLYVCVGRDAWELQKLQKRLDPSKCCLWYWLTRRGPRNIIDWGSTRWRRQHLVNTAARSLQRGDAARRYRYCSSLLLLAPGATDKDGHLFMVQHEIRAASIVAASAGRDENIQVNGYTFVFDFSGIGTKHLTHWSMDDMRNWHSCWQVVYWVLSIYWTTCNKRTCKSWL